ncbi:hypothetical protein FA10DRAFT_127707 [Acaromyces ingoldii]|uniref:Uncharacterized protein n=1 Tax=Acaromyces ingoldii TaxID=215250 RepID=A0A316YNS6_9BASI|nr:hypothetical protein FA10DRAFT_127707 [Acaromyces ingoldii]PWN90929.1 hypothetical protein FA10DRAFT_127707 [Acaromyces ingoldii]
MRGRKGEEAVWVRAPIIWRPILPSAAAQLKDPLTRLPLQTAQTPAREVKLTVLQGRRRLSEGRRQQASGEVAALSLSLSFVAQDPFATDRSLPRPL